MTPTRLFWGFLILATLARLALAAGLGPGNDEAYYALFVEHPDWSYFDQPPMLAVIEAVGLLVPGGTRTTIFQLRLGFIGLFAGSTWLMFRLTARFFGNQAGGLAALALNGSWYYGVAVGTFVLPDGPLLFFWLWTLERLAAALERPEHLWPWVWVGLAWGGALLSKYHAVFLPLGFLLFLLAEPSARAWLRRPGPYLALGLGLIVFSPVLVWNARNDWASFAFQGGRAWTADLALRPESLALAIGAQAIYLTPWIWLGLVRRLIPSGRRGIQGVEASERFLLAQAVGPLFVFSAVACLRPVFPHWGLIGFVALMPLLGRFWAERLTARPAQTSRRLAFVAMAPLVVSGLMFGQARAGLFPQTAFAPIPTQHDPTVSMFGWDQVVAELRRRGLLDEPNSFLFTSYWYNSGQLAFALGDERPVLCYNAGDARGFAYWSRPEDWVGQDGILVALDDRSAEPHCFDRWFERIELIGQFDIVRSGVPIRPVRLFRCVGQVQPFPFGPPASASRGSDGTETWTASVK